MNVNFGCTQCGKCCHDLRLTLSVTETTEWLARGSDAQIICEAIPWPSDPSPMDPMAAYRRERSFEVSSGTLPARVHATFVGAFKGACPNLQADSLCAIYEQRPRVCRIYPAEINPFVTFVPSQKLCPGDAWDEGNAPLMRGGLLMDSATRQLVAEVRAQSVADVALKERVCRLLGIHAAAMSNSGFLIYSPSRIDLIEAIETASRATEPLADPIGFDSRAGGSIDWSFISNNASTLEALKSVGAIASRPSGDHYAYMDFEAP